MVCQPLRRRGLSQVQVGALADVEAVFRWQCLWRQKLPDFLAAGYLSDGPTSLGPRLRQRLPLSWPALGTFLAMAYVAHLALMGRVGLALLLPCGALVGALVAHKAWRRRQRMLGALLFVAVLLFALATAADLLGLGGLRSALSPAGAFSVLPVTVFVNAIMVAALVVRRYNATADAYRRLSGELAQRVRQREAELGQAF